MDLLSDSIPWDPSSSQTQARPIQDWRWAKEELLAGREVQIVSRLGNSAAEKASIGRRFRNNKDVVECQDAAYPNWRPICVVWKWGTMPMPFEVGWGPG